MMLLDLAKKSKAVLKPFSYLDVLLYYSAIAQNKNVQRYVKGKEIAAKIWLPNPKAMPFFIKRGSKDQPLFIEEFSSVNEEFLKLRTQKLQDVQNELSKQQQKIWSYFVPRKLIDFFYATNNEGQGKDIERIFLDIDRQNIQPQIAQQAAKELILQIQNDSNFKRFKPFKIFPMWTGSSFHIYVMLTRKIKNTVYDKEIAYKKDTPLESFTGRWASAIKEKIKNVIAAHEKKPGFINIDPSQTPSGKLARAPFSLHMKSPNEVDGIAIPLTAKDLDDKKLINTLSSYTPNKIISQLNMLAKKLP